MTQQHRRTWAQVGLLEAAALVGLGIVLALVFAGRVDPLALVIFVVLAYFGYMARGVWQQAQRFRPVEPPGVWLATAVANLGLMALGIGAFGWYLAGGSARAWVPFLFFIAGMMGLRMWRRGVVNRLYAWRTPALTLLQRGEYKKVVRELEAEATARRGHPDKLAVVALAYIEQNKWDRAEVLLAQARQIAPDFASVNGAMASLRRHQGRYDEAVTALQKTLAFEDDVSSRYYLGLCQYLAGDLAAAATTLRAIIDDPLLVRQGQVVGAYILAQAAEANGDDAAARQWIGRMAEQAQPVLRALDEEARRHKRTAYGDALKQLVRSMQRAITNRPLVESGGGRD